MAWGSVIWAEDQYFPQLPNATWDEARLYCQSCFRELTTVNSMNAHLIAQNLSYDYWVGLRKSYNGSIPWSRWSNGNPVTYQNWYPGHPIPNKDKKLIPICPSTTETPLSTLITVTSSPVTSPKTSTVWHTSQEQKQPAVKDTCPILKEMFDCLNVTCIESVVATCNRTTDTLHTTTYNITAITTFSTTTTEPTTTNSPTTERTTTSHCIFEPEPDPEHYIEDACVVLLNFGMWKEEDCNTSLPYICYEERFFGHIYVIDRNTSAVNVSWSEGPGAANISHYRVEITQVTNQTFKQTFNQTDLIQHIQNLTAGTQYSVQVFPVKCGRDLNPQNISFYTQPSDVQNLTVVDMTVNSASLQWRKPEGNSEFYSVTFINDTKKDEQRCNFEICTITGLIPGTEYVFTVKAVVNETFGGVASNISDYTKPSTVKNLKKLKEQSTVVQASWDPPEGGHSGYYYCLKEVDHSYVCKDCNNEISSSITTTSSMNTSSSSMTFQTTTSSTMMNSFTTNSSSTTQFKVCNPTKNNQMSENVNSDGSKFCLCVQAQTKNDTISGEMTVISAYTLPKTVTLSLGTSYSSVSAKWDIQGKYEKFMVIINTTADSYNYTTTTPNTFYEFKGLKAGVNYTVFVITVNNDLNSDPAIASDFTRPVAPAWVKANTTKDSMYVFWGAPADSEDARILYKVECYTPFWNKSYSKETYDKYYQINGLNPGTRYECNVIVLAGNLTSKPTNHSADTVHEKRTLVLLMLCSSNTPLYCNQTVAQDDLFNKLNTTIYNKFNNNVYWTLKWAKKT